MWTKFDVEMKFITKLVASLPADPDLQKKWLESRMPKVRPPDAKSIEEIAAEVADSTPEFEADEDRGFYVFQRQKVEGGSGEMLVVRMATIRAHIKDLARVLSSLYVGRIEKEKSFAVKVLNAVYYPPEVYWLPLLDAKGDPIQQPNGTYQKTIRVRTPQGERSAFKNMEYANDATLKYQLMVMTQPSGRTVISETDLNSIFEYGGVHGYGGERGDGEGRYVATITKVE
jgi:hypothetical protein